MTILTRLREKTHSARKNAFKQFLHSIRRVSGYPDVPLKVIDLGGTVPFWERDWRITDTDRLQITLINNHELDTTSRDYVPTCPFITNVNQDAMTLSTADFRRYDLIFSNSFFEHLATADAQHQLAAQVSESGVPYFIQVPNKYSPLDPHCPFGPPFFALYPKRIQTVLWLLSGFGNGRKEASIASARQRAAEYNPLGRSDVKNLFPDGTIKLERPFGVPMSILVFRGV